MNPIPPDPKTVITEVKSLRQIITINAGSLQKLPKTRETSLALTKLEEGCMWLGKELQRIGDLFPDLLKDPYPTSKDPSVGTIDPPEPEVSSPPKDNRPDWLVRLVEERDQLLERITKLARFLSKQKGGVTIDTEKLRLLKDQIQVMDQYLAILETRIRLVPVDTRPVEGGQSAPEVCTGPCACQTTEPVPVPTEEPPTNPAPKNPNLVVPPEFENMTAITDDQFAVIKRLVRGGTSHDPEFSSVSQICQYIIWGDRAGLRVMSSEDFAAVKSLIAKSRLELSTPMADTAARVLSHLGDAKVLLDAWTPPGR